jgi:hypothetical protein
MTMTARLFIGGLWALGLLTGLVLVRAPDLIPLPTPALSVPLIAALLVDLAIGPLVRAGRAEPLSMTHRAIAVIGAATIGTIIGAASV